MKKIAGILLCTVLLLTSFTACSGGTAVSSSGTAQKSAASSPESSASSSESSTPVTLNLMLNSPEITEQYKAMAAEYKKVKPNVTLNMTIIQNDYQTVLKSKLNSGDVPDLFMSSAYNDNKTYQDYDYDLTNESFMKNFDSSLLKSLTMDGKITGYPFLVQSHAFIYNKALFKKAGITTLPKTLAEYKTVCETLSAKKIQPFASGFAEWWIMLDYVYPAMADAYNGDYDTLFTDVKSGKVKFGDLPQMDFALDELDLVKKYSGNKPMEETADMQCSDIANGKAAMMMNGSWEENSIRKINSSVDIGYLPDPTKSGKSTIAVDTNLTFRVYKDSKNLKEVLALLDWITTSTYGKTWIPDVIKQISPQKDAKTPDTQLGKETVQALKDGTTSTWWLSLGPDGTGQPFGTAFQNYVAGTASRQQTKDTVSKVFTDAYNAES